MQTSGATKPPSHFSLKISPHFQQKVPERHGFAEKPDQGLINAVT
jgi:hypothetical protein